MTMPTTVTKRKGHYVVQYNGDSVGLLEVMQFIREEGYVMTKRQDDAIKGIYKFDSFMHTRLILNAETQEIEIEPKCRHGNREGNRLVEKLNDFFESKE